jgi:hypothetical protein
MIEFRPFPMLAPTAGATMWQGRLIGSALWVRVFEVRSRLIMAYNGRHWDVTEQLDNYEVMYGA